MAAPPPTGKFLKSWSLLVSLEEIGRIQLHVLLYCDLSSVLAMRQVLFSSKRSMLDLPCVVQVRELGKFQHKLQGAWWLHLVSVQVGELEHCLRFRWYSRQGVGAWLSVAPSIVNGQRKVTLKEKWDLSLPAFLNFLLSFISYRRMLESTSANYTVQRSAYISLRWIQHIGTDFFTFF